MNRMFAGATNITLFDIITGALPLLLAVIVVGIITYHLYKSFLIKKMPPFIAELGAILLFMLLFGVTFKVYDNFA